MYPNIRIRADREHALAGKHPWIFSGAVEAVDSAITTGSLVRVCVQQDVCIGVGVYTGEGTIAVRMLSWKDEEIDGAWVHGALERALSYRILLGYGAMTPTTGYRVHFAEADTIPGLIVDVYGDVVVIQIHTAAAERMREWVIQALIALLSPSAIIERSESAHRSSEGFVSRTGVVYGSCVEPIVFREYGIEYLSFPLTGQKTGFFCDQKDLRKEITTLARDRTMLNVCSYTGAQSVAALIGGAKSVHNLDISTTALEGCIAHKAHHGFSDEQFTTEQADVFQWVAQKKTLPFSCIVFDPPALIKTAKEKESGMKGYHFLNRALLRAAQPRSVYITSSCSQFFEEEQLLHMLHKASIQAEKRLRIIRVVRQSSDHPQSLYFPQSAYLKSVVAYIE